MSEPTCPTCDGEELTPSTGMMHDDTCPTCNGSGLAPAIPVEENP